MKRLFYLAMIAMMATAVLFSCDKDDDDDSPATGTGIIGEWYSSGGNVAPLLISLGVDSVYAKFNADQTYTVESYSPDGVLTNYTGTYVQTKSDVGDIYTILLEQSTPFVATSEGIFEVSMGTAGYDMRYEVVQMQPSLNLSAPTPEGGFGSTAGGAYGETNVQKYLKLN
jgi:hypothetical protein